MSPITLVGPEGLVGPAGDVGQRSSSDAHLRDSIRGAFRNLKTLMSSINMNLFAEKPLDNEQFKRTLTKTFEKVDALLVEANRSQVMLGFIMMREKDLESRYLEIKEQDYDGSSFWEKVSRKSFTTVYDYRRIITRIEHVKEREQKMKPCYSSLMFAADKIIQLLEGQESLRASSEVGEKLMNLACGLRTFRIVHQQHDKGRGLGHVFRTVVSCEQIDQTTYPDVYRALETYHRANILIQENLVGRQSDPLVKKLVNFYQSTNKEFIEDAMGRERSDEEGETQE